MLRHTRSALATMAAFAALSQVLVVSPLSGQDAGGDENRARSHSAGLVLNLHAQGGSLSTEDGTNSGGGAGAMVGYGVSPNVLIFIQVDGSEVDVEGDQDIRGSYGLVHSDLGVRYTFANPNRSFLPYLTGALSGMFAGAEIVGLDVTLRGGGVRLGGGFGYYFTRQLALDVGLSFNFGSFSSIKVENVTRDFDDTRANTSRVEVGLSWWPQG